MESGEGNSTNTFTNVLFETPSVHVFRLPSTNSLVSEEWEGKHIWTGMLRVVVNQAIPGTSGGVDSSSIDLVDTATGALFGRCPLSTDAKQEQDQCVQSATDSSRCFVLRIVKGQQHAYIGLNFPERSDAYKFSTALTERHRKAAPAQLLPEKDLSLRSDTIHVDLSGKIKAGQASPVTVVAGVGVAPAAPGALQTNPNAALVQPVSLSTPPPKKSNGPSRRITTA
jgi:hypothetical protein